MAEEKGQGTGAEVGAAETAASVADALSGFLPAEGGKETPPAEEGKPAEEVKPEEKPIEEGKPDGEVEGEEEKPGEQDVAIAALRDEIAKLNEQITTMQKGPEKPTEVKPAKYFEKAEDFEGVFEKQENFEAFIHKVKEDAKRETTESLLKNLPAVVGNLINTQMTVANHVNKFYSENKDLADKKTFVAHVSNDLAGKNPGWKLDKLFQELPKEVRARLGVKNTPGKPNSGIPGKKGGTGSRIPNVKPQVVEGVQKEIDDLLGAETGIRR